MKYIINDNVANQVLAVWSENPKEWRWGSELDGGEVNAVAVYASGPLPGVHVFTSRKAAFAARRALTEAFEKEPGGADFTIYPVARVIVPPTPRVVKYVIVS